MSLSPVRPGPQEPFSPARLMARLGIRYIRNGVELPLDQAVDLKLRCDDCRWRSWKYDGSGRADSLGSLTVFYDPAGRLAAIMSFHPPPRWRHGTGTITRRLLAGESLPRGEEIEDRRGDPGFGPWGFRTRCRRSHRIDLSPDRWRELQIAHRRGGPLYLPAS